MRTVAKEATTDSGRASRTRIYRQKARPVTVPSFGKIRCTWSAARVSIVPRWYTCTIITAMFGRHLTSRAECRYRGTRTRACCSATRYSCTVASCRTPPWPTRSGRSTCPPRSGRTSLCTMIATTKRYVAHWRCLCLFNPKNIIIYLNRLQEDGLENRGWVILPYWIIKKSVRV